MIKKSAAVLTLILLMSVSVAFGQTEKYRFSQISFEEGLVSGKNYGIAQDQKGYTWLASESGIIKYNGRSFQTFELEKKMHFNTTFDLNIDKQGTVWCSTGDGRVYFVRNDSIVVPACSDSLHVFLQKGKKLINEIGLDGNNRLWIGNTLAMAVAEPGEGYSKLHLYRKYSDTVNTVVQVIGPGKTIMSKNNLDLPGSAAYPKGNGIISYADGYGVNCQVVFGDGSSSLFTARYPASQRYVPTGESIELQDGSVLFSMSNSFCQAFKDGTHKMYKQDEAVLHFSQDHFGNVWVGTSSGLLCYRNGDLQSNPDTLLQNKIITGALVDKDNGLWVATATNGLYYAPNLFHTYLQMTGTEDESPCHTVFQQGKYIYAYSNAAGEFRIDSNNNLNSIPSNDDRMLLETISDDKYIYSYRISLNRLDSSMHIAREISKMSFYAATRDKMNKVFLIGNDGVYSLWHDSLREICRTPEGRPTSIAITTDGKIWIGTSVGLYLLKNDQLEKKSIIDNGRDTIKRVKHLFADKNGDLYVANFGPGIYIFHDSNCYTIDSSSIPMFSGANRVFTDADGKIWACTVSGLLSFRYDFNSRKCYEITWFEWNDGLLPGVVFNAVKYNGKVYVATSTGLSVFLDSPFSFNRNPPPVYISRFEINDTLINQALIDPVFTYDQNSIRFFIDVLDYQARGKPLFKYKLSGFDKNFLTSNEASVSYTNLPPGEYELIVTGISNNGFESKPVSFKFRIRSPFWMTWWFIALEIIFGASLVAIYLRFRIRKVRRQEEEKAAINIQMASYQMAALRAQMNPHFIFNAINSIQRFVLGNDQQTAYSYLAKFSRLIRQVLNNSKEELISLKDELDTLNLYLEMENLRFEKQFDFEVEIDQSIATSDTYIPCMLIQPFIENAIWHGIMPLDNSRKGKIKLQFLRKELSLFVVIEDNGAGRKTSGAGSKSHKSMGISIAKNRLHLYDTHSKESHSTIEYTDMKTETGEPCGTIVRIELDGFFNENRNESNHS